MKTVVKNIILFAIFLIFTPCVLAREGQEPQDELPPEYVAALPGPELYLYDDTDTSSEKISPVAAGELFQVLDYNGGQWMLVGNAANHLEGYIQASQVSAPFAEITLPEVGSSKETARRYTGKRPDPDGEQTVEWALWTDRVGNLCALETIHAEGAEPEEIPYTGRARLRYYTLDNMLDPSGMAAGGLGRAIIIWNDMASRRGIYIDGILYQASN